MIKELALSKGFWSILALDHGLTVGHSDSVTIHKIPKLLEDCESTVGSVVMTYGLARYIGGRKKMPMIIQCFGAPLGHPKVQVCSVENALEIGAKGVAVQVDFSLKSENMLDQLRSIAKFASQAHSENLPVLFMVAPHEMSEPQELSHSIRFCIELGADLIKVRCNTLELNHEARIEFKDLLRSSPPVLLAGGAAHNNITEEVAMSRKIGFSGYCIGRNIFKADNPGEMSQELRNAWQNNTINIGELTNEQQKN